MRDGDVCGYQLSLDSWGGGTEGQRDPEGQVGVGAWY